MALPAGLISAITVTRYAAGAYNTSGVWVEGATSSVTVNGLVNPEKDQDILMREGGGYADGVIKIYTNEALYPKSGAQQADRLTRGGKVYEVYEVNEPYSNLSLDHYRSRARRVDALTNGA